MQVLTINAVNQKCRIKCEGEEYSFRLTWNARAAAWVADIATTEGVEIASGITLRKGANNVRQLRLGIGSIVILDAGNIGEPTADSLGDGTWVVQLTEAETNA